MEKTGTHSLSEGGGWGKLFGEEPNIGLTSMNIYLKVRLNTGKYRNEREIEKCKDVKQSTKQDYEL